MLNMLRPVVTRVLEPVAVALARTPVTPNALTIAGTAGVCAGSLGLFPTGHLLAGTIVCAVFVLTDLLDGTLARVRGTTGSFGAFLDSTMDRIADASIFGGLTIWFMLGGRSTLLAGVALYCVVAGAMVSYAKARAEGLGLRCDVGFAERSMRTLIGLVATGVSGLGVPYVLPAGLWVLAAASTFTFGQRVLAVHHAAAGQPAPGASPAPGSSGRPTSPGVPPADPGAEPSSGGDGCRDRETG